MKTFNLGLTLLLGVLALCTAFENKQQVSVYPGRSGDIIITPPTIDDDSFVVLLGASGVTSDLSSAIEIEETSVADLIGHLVGVSLLNEHASRQSFPKGSLFNKAAANLLVVVDSLGSDSYDASSLSQHGHAQTMKLKRMAFPQDTIASLATLISGYTPSVHGIVNSHWKTPQGIVAAYGAGSLPATATITDIISQSFHGKSLIMSLSADFQMASAFGAHQYLQASNQQWNNYGFYYDKSEKSFKSIYLVDEIGSPFTIQKEEILQMIAKRYSNTNTITYHERTNSILFVMDNTEIKFPLNQEENFLFFAEIEFVLNAIEQLKSNEQLKALTTDSTPDMYNIVFSSVKALAKLYGRQSTNMQAAQKILDNTLTQIIKELNHLYDNKLTAEVVFLSPNSAYNTLNRNKQLKNTVYNNLKQYIKNRSVFDTFFPSVYFSEQPAVKLDVCTSLDAKLPVYEVQCPITQNSLHLYSKYILETNSVLANDTTDDTDNYPDYAVFNIVLWSSIILVLVLSAVIYSLAYMDVGADTLLYRMTSSKNK